MLFRSADGKLTEEELSRLMSDPEMQEAIGLIEDFVLEEYNDDSVDIRNPRQVGLAYGVSDSGAFEIQVDVNLLDFSISQTVDGKCVETRQYDSLRELIDQELAFLDYGQLIYLEPHIEEQLEADLYQRVMEEEAAGAREGVEPTMQEPTAKQGVPTTQEELPEMVEIEGGTIGEDGPLLFTSPRLPYDIVVEKLPTGSRRSNFHITNDELGTGGQKTKYQKIGRAHV